MGDSGTAFESYEEEDPESSRSRASSIVTTTTKFSVETLSQDDRESITALLGRHNLGPPSRPRSMLSITNPAPPYEEAIESSPNPLPLLRDLQYASNSSARASRIHSANGRSGAQTPVPQSPLDADGNVQAAYYSNVVRTLDQNYTLELERLRKEHEQALAVTRHNIDQAYREQWKAKNKEIEQIREQTAAAKYTEVNDVRLELGVRIEKLETEVENLKDELDRQANELTENHRVAESKARHEIEDLWEKRWNDRTRIENEEKLAREREARKTIDISVLERDNLWIKIIMGEHPELLDGLKAELARILEDMSTRK